MNIQALINKLKAAKSVEDYESIDLYPNKLSDWNPVSPPHQRYMQIVAFQLAQSNNINQLKWLAKRVAGWNNVLVYSFMLGIAQAKNINLLHEMYDLISNAAEPGYNKKIMESDYITCIAYANDINQIELLKKNQNNKFENAYYLARGFTMDQNHDAAADLCKNTTQDLISMFEGYIVTGQYDNAKKYVSNVINAINQEKNITGNEFKRKNRLSCLYYKITSLLSEFKLENELNFYIQTYPEFQEILKSDLVARGVSESEIIGILSTSEPVKADSKPVTTTTTTKNTPVTPVIDLPATQKQQMITAVQTYLKNRSQLIDTTALNKTQEVKQYRYTKAFRIFGAKSYNEKKAAVEALVAVLQGGDASGIKQHMAVLRNGNLGETIRNLIKTGQANAMVSVPVNTVSEFITALENGNLIKAPSKNLSV